MATAEVCRRHGVSQGTFYKWKAKFGSMTVSDAKKLRALEDENGKGSNETHSKSGVCNTAIKPPKINKQMRQSLA